MRLAQEARRIATQHSHLAALEAMTVRALDQGEQGGIVHALQAFEGSLDAHFKLEEELHFPALHGMRPELGPELTELVREHGQFRAALASLLSGAAAGDGAAPPAATAAGFRDLTAQLGRHEAREERILAETSPQRS